MKLFLALLFCCASCFSQVVVPYTPVISTTEIDSVVVTSGSSTVYSVTKPFSNVTAGMHIAGLRFPLGTTVTSNTNDSILVLSNSATSSVALDSIRVGIYTSAIYAAGDAVGFAFEVPQKLEKLNNIIVEDDAKQITAIKLIFFGKKFTETEDNMVFAPSDADAANIIGYLSLATSEVFSVNQIVTSAATALPINFNMSAQHIYCQLVCVGTPTFTAVNNLHINFIGQ